MSAKHRWLNELVGYVSSIPFEAPYLAFRHLHLQHHKYTNHPEKDPDAWSSGHGPLWVKPLFWVTQVRS